ncbi:metal-dependent phosphohydrolase [Geomonas sp. Red276]
MKTSNSLVEVVKARMAAGTPSIPVFHAVALKLQQVLAQKDYSIEDVHQLIIADPGLASNVLRVANSAFYAGLSKVETIREAIIRLGAGEVTNLVMLTTQQDLYRSRDARFGSLMQTLWRHALSCAVGSKWLVQKSGYPVKAQEAFLGGLLHDIGKLYLLKLMEGVCKEEQFKAAANLAVLTEVLETLHVEEGLRLMVQWHMPEVYCGVVAGHDADQWDPGDVILAAVRLANLTCRKLGVGLRTEADVVLFASAEARALGLKEISLAELEIVIEDALKTPVAGKRKQAA